MAAIRITLFLFMLPAVAWADALIVTASGVASSQDVAGGKAGLRAYALDSARDAALRHAESEVSQKQNEYRYEGNLNGFSTLFKAFVIKFCKHMPVHYVCQLTNISDYKSNENG